MVEATAQASAAPLEESSGQAIQFAVLKNNEITITDEAMEFLGSLPCDQKLCIVTFVGQVNSSKSTLANKLVGSEGEFALRPQSDPTPESKKNSFTQGISMASAPIKLAGGALMLVLDMQGLPPSTPQSASSLRSPRTSALRSPRGLAALRQSNPTDRLLAFASLVSSLLVFTQIGSNPADQMVESLEPITKFSDQIQREMAGELGAKASILSTSSVGNMSTRSFGNSSVLDITTTVAGDLKDIMCQSFLCVLNEFTPSEAQATDGVTPRKAAKLVLEGALQAQSGVTNETIRKNKTVECLKNIFSQRSVLHLAPKADPARNKDLARLVGTIKRKSTPKQVCGKALNANMLLALSLEYAETLSQPPQSALTLPGGRGAPSTHSLVPLLQAFSRVAEEEVQRIADITLAQFKDEMDEQVNEQTMPLGEKRLKKICKSTELKFRDQLRAQLAEITSFEELMLETERMEERMKQVVEAKRQENYSQGYYFSVGLLKQLYAQHFAQVELSSGDKAGQLLSAVELKRKWVSLIEQLQFSSGVNGPAQWDVFAECFIRLPLEERSRFVDYRSVEVEQFTDLAAETESDTLASSQEGGGIANSAVPSELLNDQIQIMSLLEAQIERIKQGLSGELTESQVQAQKVYQSQQELQQAKIDNEARSIDLKQQTEALALQKNDTQLKVQGLERERNELDLENESITALTGAEQLKHKAQLEKQSGVLEQELDDQTSQVEQARKELASLDAQLQSEENELRAQVQAIEAEIQTSRDEQDQMEEALAHRDQSAVYQQVSTFLGQEVPDQYLAAIKEVFAGNTKEAKELKLQLFEEQRKLNEVDYQFTQEQVRLKQQHDEQFKALRQRKERDLQEAQLLFEQTRRRHLELARQKESINEQLQAAMRSLEEQEEEVVTLNEAKNEQQARLDEDVSNIVQCKATLTEAGDNMESLEQQIYELSVQNRNQLGLKERYIELISEVVKSTQRGKPTPEMTAILNSLPEDRNKQRLQATLMPKAGTVN